MKTITLKIYKNKIKQKSTQRFENKRGEERNISKKKEFSLDFFFYSPDGFLIERCFIY